MKILGAVAGIKTKLTSYVGRRTMGSFLVDANVDKKAAMAMLGVKKEAVVDLFPFEKKQA